ncbi:MAG TPA: hypothetical protein PKK39_06885 [Tepidiformaceae bacterium]|nr:hypothetical protein [Tepidiformaceae bacterium]
MQFEARFRQGIASGDVTQTFRRWKRNQVVAGNTYRTAAGRLVVDEVSVVEPAAISNAEAVSAGYESAEALLTDLRGDGSLPVYRVRFHAAPGEDSRDLLAADAALDVGSLANITHRLERLDHASPSGPWTRTALLLIARNPGVRAGDLAPQAGQETLDFKRNVRKLKNLGLTISLEVGYRLSPRGELYWQSLAGEP